MSVKRGRKILHATLTDKYMLSTPNAELLGLPNAPDILTTDSELLEVLDAEQQFSYLQHEHKANNKQ